MRFIRSAVLAFSMFSRLPMPNLKWDEQNMRYMLGAFPLIGAVIGLLIWGWLWICEALGFGVFLRAAGLTLLPVAVTGGIHLDGFCDTVDALASRAPQERKREILKDPHTGAFAVIGVAAYLLLYFGLSAELVITSKLPLLLGIMFIVSRSLSGLSVLMFGSSASTGLASTFKVSADKRGSVILLFVFFALCIAGLVFIGPLAGGAMLAAAFICMIYLFFMSRCQFGGMSGDLAGFFLQTSELAMVLALVIIEKAVTR
jgi:adenosylcobinamide-GDP ribazoletransferase